MDLVIKNGKNFNMASVDESFNTLPLGTYTLDQDQNSGAYFLEKTEDLKYPGKLYGNFDIVNRWINTYEEREGNLGVLLSGLKGSGKTITAKMLALRANKPIILVKAPFYGLHLKKFFADKRLGDCVVLIDEFEKIYEDYGNVDFLEILDGTANTHHLFIFTVNEENISDKMLNRPSRIFYRKRYSGLEEDVVREVGEDLLKDKNELDNLVETMDDIEDLSYDILISVIEEMNRYNITAAESINEMCVDKKDRPFYLIQKISINEKPYYIMLDGGQGKNYFLHDSYVTPVYFASEQNDSEKVRSSGLYPFSSYNGKDVEFMEQMGRTKYRIFPKNMRKINKHLFVNDLDEANGINIMFVESRDRSYFNDGTVLSENDFKEIVLGETTVQMRPRGAF